MVFKNCNRLGVSLTTLFAFGLGLPAAFAQVVTLPTAGDGWAVMAAALDPETDDIMVAGTGVSAFGEFVASSVAYSGSVNTNFGGGLVTTQVSKPSIPDNWCYACAVQSDGKLLAGGFYSYATGSGFALVRYNTDGTLDTKFGTKGIVEPAPAQTPKRFEPWSCKGAGPPKKLS